MLFIESTHLPENDPGCLMTSFRPARRLLQHRGDGRNRVPLQAVVDEDERLPVRPRRLALGNQRPASDRLGLLNEWSSVCVGRRSITDYIFGLMRLGRVHSPKLKKSRAAEAQSPALLPSIRG